MSKISKKTAAKLLRKNIILLKGKISRKMYRDVFEHLSILESRGSPDIEVRIFSEGGSIPAGLGIYDAFRRYAGEKTGVVYAHAMSMGAIILQACDDRVCLTHATILIHNPSFSVESASLEDFASLEQAGAALQADQKQLDQILIARTGRSEDEIHVACLKNELMSAHEALAFGLIDRIEGEEKQPTEAQAT